MEPIAYLHAVDAMRRHVNSALPHAPVVPGREPRRRQRPGPVRRGTATTLRRIANRLEPASY